MKENVALRKVMDLRAGVSLTFPQLTDVTSRAAESGGPTNVVFADWVFSDEVVGLITARDSDAPPKFSRCTITTSAATSLVRRFSRGEGIDRLRDGLG